MLHLVHMAATEIRRTLVVAGNGMVGHKLLEILAERGATAEWDIVTFCEERRPANDRVGLSSFFNGTSADELSLVSEGFFDQLGLTIHLGDAVAAIDRAASTVTSTMGKAIAYDAAYWLDPKGNGLGEGQLVQDNGATFLAPNTRIPLPESFTPVHASAGSR